MTPSPRPHPAWQVLGRIPPAELSAARLELHAAVQCVAAVSATHLPPAPDDSHASTEWLAGPGALAGPPVPGARPFRTGLRLADATVLVLETDGSPAAELPAQGRTLDQLYQWLEETIAARSGGAPRRLRRTDSPVPPDHPVSRGQPFRVAPGGPYAELAAWYADAAGALARLTRELTDASPVRCWPHHFDIATLATLARGPAGEATRTIGIGMTPGDASYAEPYWYVTPWPYPAADRPRPDLPAGHWHSEGWTGAVLNAAATVTPSQAGAQAARVDEFLRSAVQACRQLLA